VGNRTETTRNGTATPYTYDPAGNRLATVGGAPYTHDAAGNLLDNGARSFGYDARGRLARATKPDGTVYSYGINGLGQRVGKASPALSTGGRVYVYDEAGHLLGEYDRTGARVWEHVYLGDTPVAVIGSGGAVHYVLSDHLNTPRQIVNAAYQLRWRWDPADPFGDNAADTNPQGLGGFGYNLRFPGQYFDAESGLHYNYYRDYDPGIGRYVESDPIGLAGGMNTYAYVDNNPLNWVDSLGLIKLPADPSGLPPNWHPDPSHRDPNGERWTNGNDVLDFHKGRPGMPGWRGKDHWHHNGEDKHLKPGDECPTSDDQPEDDTPDQNFQIQPPPPWIWIIPFIPFPGNPIYGGL
jgi:RHS repeat-associated protein